MPRIAPDTNSESFVRTTLQSMRKIFVRLLAQYFRIVNLPESLQRVVEERDKNYIVTESGSFIVEALLYSFAKRSGLKGTINVTDKNCDQLPSEHLVWLSLHSQKSLDAILKQKNNKSFVTLNIFSGRGPFKNNPQYRLGFWDLTGILVLGRFLTIFFGQAIHASPNSTRGTASLVRNLKVDFFKNLKLVRGTPFHHIDQQAELVIDSQDFKNELNQLAGKLDISPARLTSKAHKAFYDIAANPRRPMYRIVAFVARLITNRLFTSVQTIGLTKLESAVRESTVVIVPMHRSHFDYIIIGSKLYESHLNPPLVAAGINLSFWPIGFVIRSVGGYFVKRNVRNDRLHALILKRYVSYLVKRGHLQEFFIEGGRSRSGRMRQPKVGLLSVFIDAYVKGYKRDIAFVPVSITYENVIEDSAYGHENTGRGKERENLWALIKAGSIFRKKYGDVVINFGDAISLDHYLEDLKAPDRLRGESKQSVTNLALKITRSIRDQTNPSLTSLLNTALLLAPKYGLTKSELISTTKNLADLLSLAKNFNPSMGEFTPALQSFLAGNETFLSEFSSNSTIQVKKCADELVYYIPGERRFTADFYKNSTIHLFFPAAIFSILHLMNKNFTSENTTPFYEVFSHDFILDQPNTFYSNLDSYCQGLLQAGYITLDSQHKFTNQSSGIFVPSLLLPHIESLNWCLAMIHSYSDEMRVEGLDYESVLNRLQNEFRAAAYLGRMTCTEASSVANLVSSLDTLQSLGIITVSEKSGKKSKIKVHDTSSNARIDSNLKFLNSAQMVIRSWQNGQLVKIK